MRSREELFCFLFAWRILKNLRIERMEFDAKLHETYSYTFCKKFCLYQQKNHGGDAYLWVYFDIFFVHWISTFTNIYSERQIRTATLIYLRVYIYIYIYIIICDWNLHNKIVFFCSLLEHYFKHKSSVKFHFLMSVLFRL